MLCDDLRGGIGLQWERGILPREAGEVIQTWTKDNLNGKGKQQKEVLTN